MTFNLFSQYVTFDFEPQNYDRFLRIRINNLILNEKHQLQTHQVRLKTHSLHTPNTDRNLTLAPLSLT